MNELFDWCVSFLIWAAPQVGMTYQEINIWLFVIIQPGLIVLFAYLWLRARRSKRCRFCALKDDAAHNWHSQLN
jgi:hypothetical protein